MYVQMRPERVKIKGYKYDDCTVNSLANILGISYDLSRKIYQTIEPTYSNEKEIYYREVNPRKKDDFTRLIFVLKMYEYLGNTLYYEPLKSKRNLKVSDFVKANLKGDFIVLTEGHITTVVDGILIDTWDSSDLPIVAVYEMNVIKIRRKIRGIASYYNMNNDSHFFQGRKTKIKNAAIKKYPYLYKYRKNEMSQEKLNEELFNQKVAKSNN